MRLDDDSLSPSERLQEVARILAGGILRLHIRGALQAAPAPENPSESSPYCLEPPRVTALSVHTG